ncbi:MAG: fimbrial protein [Rhizobiaceae bacterium]|nr:fimbrial protein [Rhizobiaceae bacterium]
MANEQDDKDEKPLDPAAERVRRKMVRFMGINLGILFAAVMAVVLALVYKSVSTAPETPGEVSELPGGVAATGTITLPAGARIVSQSLSGTRLSLQLDLSGGGRSILVFDIVAGRIVGDYTIVETAGD